MTDDAQQLDHGERPIRVAMQSRCPHCRTEQYVFGVYEFSHGELPCSHCRQLTHPMSFDDYHAALRATDTAL